jgi:putative endopeptidase
MDNLYRLHSDALANGKPLFNFNWEWQRMRRIAKATSALILISSVCLAAVALRSGIEKGNIDPKVRGQDDLFRHVNGKWLKEAVIPPDRSMDGAFHKLRDNSESDIRAIIDATAANKDLPAGSEAQKIRDFYLSFMDETKAEELGIDTIKDELAQVDAITDKAGFLTTAGKLSRAGTDGLLGLNIDTDAKKSDQYILYIGQGGIGLPDEAYYHVDKFKPIRDAYVAHIGKLFALANLPEPTKAAATVMAIETRIANGHWDRVKSRDDTLTYNKKSVAELAKLTPGIEWNSILESLGAKDIKELIVRQPSFFEALDKTVAEIPLDQWKTWLKWDVLHSRAPFLSKAFVDENFAFFGKTLTGAPENRPRWKRGVGTVERALGESLGKLYVEKHFPPAAKAKMQILVANLIEAYRQDIKTLDWMSAETKTKALEKLSKFTPKIGYPDKWRDYSSLEIKPGDLLGNVRRASIFETDRQFAKIGKPVDKSEWLMTPQTVNAYYNPGMNEIVFPASILQPPFFDLEADDAVNYGGIGAVIGHEIGHGFDDQGSKFDGDGNMKDWWTPADRKEFEKRANMLIEQYNSFEPAQLPGQHVNGALTIGENIGDLGGLTIGYKAYNLSLKGTQAPILEGLTGAQRFFIGWAQVWRTKGRDAELQRRLATDPHSPAEFRCNGVIRNLVEFYDAFGVKEGDKLWLPEDRRVRIW